MTEQTGRCLCGAVSYRLAAEPLMQVNCHCSHCQRQSGSAFSTIIGVPETALEVTGAPSVYADTGESGKTVHREFCGTCGSPLFSRVEVMPGMVFVKVGTLDDTSGFTPQSHIWTRSKQDWVDCGAIPSFATNPG
ncbi:MAG: GFA family protein [Sphingomonadaceae bacterium]|nr:GFA family protein [Sphingomonadaceae bacterium]